MATRPKSGRTGTRRGSTRSRKPATIDLQAKEVETADEKSASAAAKTGATKTTSTSTKSPEFGRSTGDKSDDKAKATTPKTSVKTDVKKEDAVKSDTVKTDTTANSTDANAKGNEAKQASVKDTSSSVAQKSGGGLFSGLVGAVVAVVGLGAVGQYEGAKNIPLIGSLYGDSSQQASTISESDFAALQAKVAELSALDTSGTNAVDLGPVNEKIAALESSLKALSQAGAEGTSIPDAALSGRIDTIEAGLDALKQELARLVATPVTNDSGDAEKLSDFEQQLSELAGKFDAVETTVSQNSQGISNLVSQSTELKDTVASVQASEKVAKSVAVNALATALDNDDALTLPISSLEALVGELPATQRLAELGKAGIPSIKELVTELDQFTSGVQNPSALPENASLSDKFWANAQNLVSFRSTGPREGDDPLAILSRVRNNVKNSELVAAKAEWEKLSAEIQQQGSAWVAKLNTRLEAYALQKEISSKLALQAG